MRYVGPILGGFVVLIILGFIAWSGAESYDIRSAGQQGMEWMVNYEGNYGNPGITWALQEVYESYCPTPEYHEFFTSRIRPDLIRDEVIAAYYAKTVQETGAPFPNSAERGFDSLLLTVLYCDAGTISESVERDMRSFSESEGYELTHQYLALLFFKEKQCVSHDSAFNVDEAISEAAHRIQSQIGPWGDIYPEQVSFLLYGGFQDLVSQAHIDTILAHQEEDGGWRHAPEDPGPNPHTTILSVWALAQWADFCPFTNQR
ncbi:hypothetical protein K2Y00_03530 [Patescibacteria group bacterium]|nr:hypothetical protein [Patescibacteria group bacterium]